MLLALSSFLKTVVVLLGMLSAPLLKLVAMMGSNDALMKLLRRMLPGVMRPL